MTMTENTQTALKILKQAMDFETEGNKFYAKAARTTKDEKGQELFKKLAGDEQNHYDLIKREYNSLKEEKVWLTNPPAPAKSADLSKPLFPKGLQGLKNKITEKSSDWDALLFGLDIEIRTYDLYRNAAAETADPRGKQVLEFLAGQEMGHFNMLMVRYEALFGPAAWFD